MERRLTTTSGDDKRRDDRMQVCAHSFRARVLDARTTIIIVVIDASVRDAILCGLAPLAPLALLARAGRASRLAAVAAVASLTHGARARALRA